MDPTFAVRPLPSTTLDGAFRIHVSAESLEQLGLKLGDLCGIADEDGTTVGYGISWRANEGMGTNPKVKPAKMTEVLRSAFSIADGAHVGLSKTSNSVLHAEKVMLSDVTPSDYNKGKETKLEDGRWRWRCGSLLSDCEAIAQGIAFDIKAKGGIRKRFFVESVESSEAQIGPPSLFYFDDKTEIVFTQPGDGLAAATNGTSTRDLLSTEHIGGLLEQIQILNRRMRHVLQELPKGDDLRNSISHGTLIHGYEGTGKSLILQRIGKASCRTMKINKSLLDAAVASKNRATIENVFERARSNQPCVVLIDDIDKIAPPTEDVYSSVIASELDRLRGMRVLVVAACRNPSDVNPTLTKPGRLSAPLELPIPDTHARVAILRALLHIRAGPEGTLAHQVGLRTHGFTGEDLARLVETAERDLSERALDDDENPYPRPETEGDTSVSFDVSLLDGHAGGTDGHAEEIDDRHDRMPMLTIHDFEGALGTIRPTALREVIFEQPNVRWDQVGGSQAVKERFDRVINWPLQHPDVMARMHRRPAKGVLLYGPPGCSKTLTAQAVATTYGLNFIAIKGAELVSMYVGESERKVRDMFRKARAAAPCVIFFDEIDSIAAERDNAATKGLNVLTTLLNEMDGFESLKNVLVLAATNKPEVLDPAIMRPGRFDVHLYLGPPNAGARKEIFNIRMKDIPVEEDMDFSRLVKETEGYTGAEMVQICDVAVDHTIARYLEGKCASGGTVGLSDLQRGLSETGKGVTSAMLAGYEDFSRKAAAR